MKTHILVSVDVDVAEKSKKRAHGFTSKTCNDALKAALEMPDSKQENSIAPEEETEIVEDETNAYREEQAHKGYVATHLKSKADRQDKVWVPAIGWVSTKGASVGNPHRCKVSVEK